VLFRSSKYVEPNFKYNVDFVPNDPYWNQQWGPTKIGVDKAWNTTTGDPSILVAVIDTGVDWDHPDLVANYVPLGYDWVNNDTDPMDDHGHGTHCAGIIAASLNNSIGIAGIAQVHIMAEKAINEHGIGDEASLANAIIHAVDQGAKILSNSWGDTQESELIHNAIKYAYDQDVLVVAAAGNWASKVKMYPAAYDEVVAVTATNQTDSPASFTSFGNWVELAAPGVKIYSTMYDNDYANLSGTSMACPHVSGVAALAWSMFPNATRNWIRQWLHYTADDLGEPGFDEYYGYGRINAEKAVTTLPLDHELVVLNLQVPQYIEPGNTGKLNSTIFNFGKSNENNLTIQLLANGSVVDSVSVDSLASGFSRAVTFSWSPTVKGKYNVTSYAVPLPSENSTLNNCKSAIVRVYHPEVVLFQNVEPWGYLSNEEALNSYNIPFAMLSSENFEAVNLSQFVKVIIASDQDQTFYNAVNASRWWFEDYVANGGVLEIHAADLGRHDGSWGGPLPGGITWNIHETNHLTTLNRTHPIVNTPNLIADKELDGWIWSAHGYFSACPNNTKTIITDDYGRLVCLEFRYGRGLIIASGQTLEWAYGNKYSNILENSLLYPIYKCEHELATFLEAPVFLIPASSSLLNATVTNYGSNNETNVNLQILVNGEIIDSTTIPELTIDTSYTHTYLWTPTEENTYNITGYAEPLLEEKTVVNNAMTEFVHVRSTKHVLFDQTHGADNIACYSIWINALSERGFVIYTYTSGTITLDRLKNYDAFVIPQADIAYLPSEIAAIKDYVLDGGGLLIIGDNSPSIYTNLTSFAGITWTTDGTSGVTEDITPHPVTLGVTSVHFVSSLTKMNVLDVAQSLVRLEGDIMLAVSVQVFGKVIGFADENSLWDFGIQGADNFQLANNMMEWLATPVQYEHETLVKLESPLYLSLNGSALLNATVYNRGMNNETNIQLTILINGNIADATQVPELLVGVNYTLSFHWVPAIEGVYNVTAFSMPMPNENNTMNNIVSTIVRVGYANIAVINTFPNMTEAYGNWTIDCTVSVENQGNFTEAFSVTLYANSTLVDVQTVSNLAPKNQTTLIFYWKTTNAAKGKYAIISVAEQVLGETDTADNTCVYSWVLITKVGDIGGGMPPEFFACDMKTDGKDLALFLQCYKGLAPSEAMRFADLGGGVPLQFFKCDGIVDGKDLALFLQCYKGLGP